MWTLDKIKGKCCETCIYLTRVDYENLEAVK
jgi:hypothetical protein